jgi:putative transposase
MPNYQRNLVPGGTFFFTVVVHQRHPIFHSAVARKLLRNAIQSVRTDRPFQLCAVCLLPDHIHTVWILPPGDSDYSTRWRKIKEGFTTPWLEQGGWEGEVSKSRRARGERGVWQRRYWEHTVRDDDDLRRCVDYTHWNPRKHGLVSRIRDWPYSSFFRFASAGEYEIDWGGTDPCPNWSEPDAWGE